MAPTNLKTSSRVKPTIRKGNAINQTKGKRKIAIIASGQQITKRMHQSISEISIFILMMDMVSR
jgi:hypothetical protein